MPRDPIRSINEQRLQFDREQAETRALAAKSLAEVAPEFVSQATDEQLEDAIGKQSMLLRAQRQRAGVPTTDDPSFVGFPPDLNAPRAFTSQLMDMLPEGGRPESTFDALGLRALESIGRGETPDMGDVGTALTIPLTGIGGLLARPGQQIAKNTFGALMKREAMTLAGAAGGAGVSGMLTQRLEAAQRVFDQSQELQRQNKLSRIDAFVNPGPAGRLPAMMMRGLSEAMFEAATGGLFATGSLFRKASFGKFAGLDSQEVDKLMGLASEWEIDLALQDVARPGLIRRARDVLGRFPLLASPFVESAQSQTRSVSRAVQRSIGDVAPVVGEIVESAAEDRSARIMRSNVNAFNRLNKAFSTFRDEANTLYKQFTDRAGQVTVGPANTFLEATKLRKQLRDLPREGGKVPDPSGLMGKVDAQLTRILKMDPSIGLPAFIQRGHELEDLISELPQNSRAAGVLISIKQAMEVDMEKNIVGPPDVLQLKRDADEFYRDGMSLFRGQAARQVRRVDRTFGQVRLSDVAEDAAGGVGARGAGSKSELSVINTMLNSDDPGVVKNLHELLTRGDKRTGQSEYKEAVGTWIAGKFMGARKSLEAQGIDLPVTNVSALRKELGLDNKASERFIKNEQMFKLAGASIHEFDEVLGLAERIFANGVPDISTFVTRRAMLGGLDSALRTFVPGTRGGRANVQTQAGFELVSAVAKSAALIGVLRHGAGKITDPAVLRGYRILLDPKKSVQARMRAIRNLLIIDQSFLVADQALDQVISEGQFQVSGALGSPSSIANAARSVQNVFPDFSREQGASQ